MVHWTDGNRSGKRGFGVSDSKLTTRCGFDGRETGRIKPPPVDEAVALALVQSLANYVHIIRPQLGVGGDMRQ